MKKNFKAACVLLAASLFCNNSANAASLLNETITVQYFYPTFDWKEQEFDYTVGTSADMKFSEILSSRFTDTSFIIHADQVNVFSGAVFNGFRITDKAGSLGAITNVTLSSLSTATNFDISRMWFDADNI